MARTTYRVNECFWSPQGEGIRAGEMSLFLRFSGCNLRCSKEEGPKSIGGFDCDTEFESGRTLTSAELVAFCRETLEAGIGGRPPSDYSPWIVLTGGEPALQVDIGLCDDLHAAGFRLAIETNGSIHLGSLPLDWITVSPKVAEHAVRQLEADEVKYVRGYGQAIPKPACKARHRLISPAFDGLASDPRAVAWCLKLVRENPEWRLSPQHHKLWGVR